MRRRIMGLLEGIPRSRITHQGHHSIKQERQQEDREPAGEVVTDLEQRLMHDLIDKSKQPSDQRRDPDDGDKKLAECAPGLPCSYKRSGWSVLIYMDRLYLGFMVTGPGDRDLAGAPGNHLVGIESFF